MTDPVQRTRGGQFLRGQSGNPAGARARQPKELLTLADFNRCILQVAARRTSLNTPGGAREVSMLEANITALAYGKGVNRLAAKDFIDLVRQASVSEDGRAHRADLQERQQRGREREL